MSAAIPAVEPTTIIAGDTIAWTKSLADYSAADGWALSYVLLSSGKTPLTISSSASGSDHAVSVAAATTAAYAAAVYHWTSMVTKGTERKTISTGTVQILPNPATQVNTYDPRTHAEKCLAAIEAVLEGRSSDSIVEYQIDGRMAKRIPHLELVRLRTLYAAEVRRQKGGPRAIAIPVRFNRV